VCSSNFKPCTFNQQIPPLKQPLTKLVNKYPSLLLLLVMGVRGKPRMCTAAYWLIVPPALDVPILATRCPRSYSTRSALQRRELELMGILPRMPTSMVHLGIFYMPQILRHGTHGLTSLQKEGALRIFALKNPTASARFEPANLGSRGQYANP
jgi:hypothetical protein